MMLRPPMSSPSGVSAGMVARRVLSGVRWLACLALLPASALAVNDFSVAEQAIFMDHHLSQLKPPLTLRYTFRKSGSLEAAFEDKVELDLTAKPDGTCCAASPRFLTGIHAAKQPEVEGIDANPAILYFLERDIREMERLTQGKANYFRKRIRMAIYQGATIRSLNLPYRGKLVAVQEITVSPYQDDPNRSRYDKLANKQYVFMLADVPGGLYGIRTKISAALPDMPPLLLEEMLLDSAIPLQPKPKP